jgi:hypothetical protein
MPVLRKHFGSLSPSYGYGHSIRLRAVPDLPRVRAVALLDEQHLPFSLRGQDAWFPSPAPGNRCQWEKAGLLDVFGRTVDASRPFMVSLEANDIKAVQRRPDWRGDSELLRAHLFAFGWPDVTAQAQIR